MPVAHVLRYFRFVQSLKSRNVNLLSLVLFQDCVDFAGPSYLHMNFTIILPTSEKHKTTDKNAPVSLIRSW